MARRIPLLALCFVLVAAPAAWAQTQTGRLFGQVTDPDGNPLPGVTVTLDSESLIVTQTRVTDAQGRYLFVALPPNDDYRAQFNIDGFQTLVRDELQVSIASTTSVDVQLQLADVQETVTVTGQSPVVDTKDTTVALTYSEEMLQKVPSARDVWSLLEHQTPGVVTDRNDVGGSEQGLQAVFSARGSSWQQNEYKLNGVTVTDPSAIGAVGFYFDYDSFDEVQVSSGSHSAEVMVPGVSMNVVTKTGGNDFHGAGQYYWEGEALQGNNIDQELMDLGIESGSTVDYISDGSVQLGGPIVRDKAWFFGSYRDWRVFRNVVGFPETESTEMPVWLTQATVQLNEDHKLQGFYSRQTYFKPNRNASATITPQATWIEDDVFTVVQGQWQGILSDEAFLDARASLLDIDFPLQFQPDVTGQSRFDAATQVTSRAASQDIFFDRRRFTTEFSGSIFKSGSSGSHDMKFGLQYHNMPVVTTRRVVDNATVTTVAGEPLTAVKFNTPLEEKATVRTVGFFGQDTWTVADRFTVDFGIRFDTTKGWLPAQGGLPADDRFFPAQDFAEVDSTVEGWGGLVPRISAIYALPGDQGAIKGSFSIYTHQMGTGFAGFSNPNSTSGEVVEWNDLNGDLEFQAGEEGDLLAAFGGTANVIGPDLDSGRTREFTVGYERPFGNDWMAGVTLIYREEYDLPDAVETGLDFAADFEPVQMADGQGGTITVFNQVSGFGDNRPMLTNVEAKETEYKGVDFIVRRRFADNYNMQASLTLGDSSGLVGTGTDQSGTSNLFTSPNGLINAEGNLLWDRPYIFKISGSYLLPYDVLVAGVLRSQSGQAQGRLLSVSLNQGNVSVFTIPRGSEETRLDSITTADIRAGKEFEMPRGFRLGVYLDVFNIANANTITSSNEFTGAPTGVLGPRIARIGARITF